jgi:tetratricopeptide (TPR) repeat protein
MSATKTSPGNEYAPAAADDTLPPTDGAPAPTTEGVTRRQSLATGLAAIAASLAGGGIAAQAQPARRVRLSAHFLVLDGRPTERTKAAVEEIELAIDHDKLDPAAAMCERLGSSQDRLAKSLALVYQGDVELYRGNAPEALRLWEAASAAAKDNGQPVVRVYTDCRLVWLRHVLPRRVEDTRSVADKVMSSEQAHEMLDKLMADAKRLNNDFATAFVHHMKGVVHQRSGEFDKALVELQAAVTLREKINHLNVKVSQVNIADNYSLTSRPGQALRMLETVERPTTLGTTAFEEMALHHKPLANAAALVDVLDRFREPHAHLDAKAADYIVSQYRDGFRFNQPDLRELYKRVASLMD